MLSKVESGRIWAELSPIDEQPLADDVIAVQPTHCLMLSKWVFHTLTKCLLELVQLILKEVVRLDRAAEGHLVS
jgi:hypothetical protein